MKLSIKPPYFIAAIRNKVSPLNSPDDLYLIHAVDDLMRAVRTHELATNADMQKRNELLERHVAAAFEYYSDFDKADMAKMALVESFLMGGDLDE